MEGRKFITCLFGRKNASELVIAALIKMSLENCEGLLTAETSELEIINTLMKHSDSLQDLDMSAYSYTL